MKANIDQVVKIFLEECRDDYVGLWSLVKLLREGGIKEEDLQRATLDLLSSLMTEGKIKAGTFDVQTGKTFNEWKDPKPAILERIESEWNSLGHEPNIGEVAWFTSQDKLN